MPLFLFRKRLTALALPLLFTAQLSLFGSPPPSALPASESKLHIHNRILAKVNGKTISVLDLVKKMDLYMSQNLPHLLDSPEGRYQFYTTNWRGLLEQMVDHELILADSAEKEIVATDSEVRELMMQRFGPNIMTTLDKFNMSYEEARTMLSTEIVVQKMTWYRVNNKAIQRVNPQDVKRAYKKYQEKNPPLQKWTYQLLSLRAKDSERAERIAKRAHQLLEKEGDFAGVAKELALEDEKVSVTLSKEYEGDSSTLSAAHQEVLSAMAPGTFSPPVSQVSRTEGSTVYRIFYLKEYDYQPTPPFQKVAERLHDQLIQESVAQETALYIQKLRSRFGLDADAVQGMLPDHFEPFALR